MQGQRKSLEVQMDELLRFAKWIDDNYYICVIEDDYENRPRRVDANISPEELLEEYMEEE